MIRGSLRFEECLDAVPAAFTDADLAFMVLARVWDNRDRYV